MNPSESATLFGDHDPISRGSSRLCSLASCAASRLLPKLVAKEQRSQDAKRAPPTRSSLQWGDGAMLQNGVLRRGRERIARWKRELRFGWKRGSAADFVQFRIVKFCRATLGRRWSLL